MLAPSFYPKSVNNQVDIKTPCNIVTFANMT